MILRDIRQIQFDISILKVASLPASSTLSLNLAAQAGGQSMSCLKNVEGKAKQENLSYLPATSLNGTFSLASDSAPRCTSTSDMYLGSLGTSAYSWSPMLAVAMASLSVMSRVPPGEEREEPRQSQVSQARAAVTLFSQGTLVFVTRP